MSSALEKAKAEYAAIDMRSIEIKAHVKALKKELAALKRRRKPLATKIDRLQRIENGSCPVCLRSRCRLWETFRRCKGMTQSQFRAYHK